MTLIQNVLETFQRADIEQFALKCLKVGNVIVFRLALLLLVSFKLSFQHPHFTLDAEETTRNDRLSRPSHSVALLDFLLRHLRKLVNGTLEVDCI